MCVLFDAVIVIVIIINQTSYAYDSKLTNDDNYLFFVYIYYLHTLHEYTINIYTFSGLYIILHTPHIII